MKETVWVELVNYTYSQGPLDMSENDRWIYSYECGLARYKPRVKGQKRNRRKKRL